MTEPRDPGAAVKRMPPGDSVVRQRPEGFLPGISSETLVLARTESVAVVINEIHAYPTGFEFTVAALLRKPDSTGRLGEILGNSPHDEGAEASGDRLVIGIHFADGRSVSNVRTAAETQDLILVMGGGSGGPQRYQRRYWASPTPPAGAVRFTCRWPAYDIHDTEVTVDASIVTSAAARSREVWS